MSAATPHFFGGAPTARGSSIRRWLSEGFMAGVGYIAAAILSCAVLFPTMTICFRRLTVCHVWVWGPVMLVAAIIVILGGGLVGNCISFTASLGGGRKYTGAEVVFCVGCGVATAAVYRGA